MKFAVVRVSPKRWQAARQRTSTGRHGIMLEDWDTFGPKFSDWRHAHDHAINTMTDAELRAHRRTDTDDDPEYAAFVDRYEQREDGQTKMSRPSPPTASPSSDASRCRR